MSSPVISPNAFDISLITPLTNEIPHLSIYNILNKNLKNTWSRELVGKTNASYGLDYESQKIMNGVLAETYKARPVAFSDPKTGNIYSANIEKINMSVDGALETEIDYLMHEMPRYLSKLYPDDVNTLYTLTAAERQSYINEALHMMHSYFDTEQIVSTGLSGISADFADLYYRVKFLTGITAVRSLTGVADQEERLANLINTGNIETYTGFEVFASPNQEYVISNSYVPDTDKQVNNLDAYYFLNEGLVKKQGVVRLHGKIRNDSLEDLLTNVTGTVNVTDTTIKGISKSFTVLPTEDPLEVIKSILDGNGVACTNFSINKMFLTATQAGLVKAGVPIDTLQAVVDAGGNEVYANTRIDWKSTDKVYPVFSYDSTSRQIIAYNDDLSVRNPTSLEEALLVTSDTVFKDLQKTHMIKLGKADYTESSLLALGNIIYSDLTNSISSNDDFSNTMETVLASEAFLLVAVVSQKVGEETDSLGHVKDVYEKVFAGTFDAEYLKNYKLSQIANRYNAEDYLEEFSAKHLFNRLSFKSQLASVGIDATKLFKIHYETVLLPDSNFIDNVFYAEVAKDSKTYEISGSKLLDNSCSLIVNWIENQNGKDVIKSITGNSSNGILTEEDDKVTPKGTVSIEGNVLTISVYRTGDDPVEIKLDIGEYSQLTEQTIDIYSIEEDESKVAVGSWVIAQIDDRKLFDSSKLSKVASASKIQRLYGNLVNTKFESETVLTNKVNLLTKEDIALNTLDISIEYVENLYDAINNNTEHYIDTVRNVASIGESYIYCTVYVPIVDKYLLPTTLLDKVSIAKIIFIENSPEFYELKTCNCRIYAGNILELDEDISEHVATQGRINSMLIDSYGNSYAVRVVKTKVQNDHCYAYLESEISDLQYLQEKAGLLILDLRRTLNTEVSKDALKERRSFKAKQVYRFKDELKYYIQSTWNDLKRSNLIYDFDNIYSNSVETTYADDSVLSKATSIPVSLSYLENLTVLDSFDSATDLFKDLIAENRSLYLDSSVKLLTNAHLSTKMLTRTANYDTIAYTYSTEIPSTLTFYNFKDYNSYEPLKDFLDLISGEEAPVELAELQKQVSRRIIVWGDVVWDANNVNKTIKTLRTIWAGYFSNFKIASTDDVLPPESIVKSSISETGTAAVKNVNVANYNYSENDGAAATDWILSTMLNDSDKEQITVDVCDAFSHKAIQKIVDNKLVEDKIDETFTKGTDKSILIESFQISLNKIDLEESEEGTVLQKHEAKIRKLVNDVNLHIRPLKSNERLSIAYDAYSKTYKFYSSEEAPLMEVWKDANNVDNYFYPVPYAQGDKQQVQLKLAYSTVHLQDENFAPLGFLGNVVEREPLQMLLEFAIYTYYVVKNGLQTEAHLKSVRDKLEETYTGLSESAWDFFMKTLVNTDVAAPVVDNVSLKDVLNFINDLYANLKIVPCVAALTEEGKLNIYYYMLGKAIDTTGEEHFYIYEGTTVEDVNGDLLAALLPSVAQNFQVSNTLYSRYLAALYKYQNNLPNSATGLPRNLSIDAGLQVKNDAIEKATSTILTDDAMSLKDTFIENNSELTIQDSLKYDLQSIFPELKLSDLTLDGTNMTLKSETYTVAEAVKYFKEYYTTTVQLSTEENDDTSSDIKACRMTFDKDFNLKNKGYLYLTDIKAPNRRSSYSLSRETQVLDRSCTLSNLHIIGYTEGSDETLRLILQDSNRSFTQYVNNAIDLITPTNTEKTTQKISSANLSIGFNWVDPGIDVDYTYYKRKFIFEGIISANDTTLIKLADEDLAEVKEDEIENFKITDHVTSGDQVQIILNSPSSYFQEGQTVELDLTQKGYHGPYKVIYSTEVSTNGTAYQYVILSGPGNLVTVKVPLTSDSNSLEVSRPYIFDNTFTHVAYALKTGRIMYLDPVTKSTYQVSTVPDYTRALTDLVVTEPVAVTIANTATVEGTDTNPNENGEVSVSLKLPTNKLYEDTLTAKHSEWYIFGTQADSNTTNIDSDDGITDSDGNKIPMSSSDVDEEDLMGASDKVLITSQSPSTTFVNIPLDDGFINFDNKDRMFLEPGEDEETSETTWLSLPDKAETFDASGHPKAFTIEDPDTRMENIVAVESASDDELKTFIRATLSEMFKSYPLTNSAIASDVLSELTPEEAENLQLQDRASGFTLGVGSTADIAATSLASLLSGKSTGTWDPETDNIYIPEVVEQDIPIYFNGTSDAKWQKAKVISNVKDVTLDTATTDELRSFAEILLPGPQVSRVLPNVTSYTKTRTNVVAWDQTTATLVIMDKLGNLKSRIAIADVALQHPVLANSLIKKPETGNYGLPSAYSLSNLVYVCGKGLAQTISKYLKTVPTFTFENKTYNVYSIFGLNTSTLGSTLEFDTNAPLYLPRILKETDADFSETDFDYKNLYDEAKNEDNFKQWLEASVRLDFLTASVCEFEAFKVVTDGLCLAKLQNYFKRFSGYSSELTALQAALEIVTNANANDAVVVKGLPYFNQNTQFTVNRDDFYAQCLTAIPASDQATRNFDSLITTSGLEVTSSTAHVYGTINWPNLDEIKKRVQEVIAYYFDNSSLRDTASDKIEEMIATYATLVEAQLRDKYTKITNEEEYKAGEKAFKVAVNLNTGVVTTARTNIKVNNTDANILAMSASSESLKIITDAGTFTLNDEEAVIVSPDADDIEEFKTAIGNDSVAIVYDALKSTNLFTNLNIDPSGTLELTTKGVSVQNANIFYSTISYATDKEIKLNSDTVMLDADSQITATILVKNSTKDNFQFGYGKVTGLENIPVVYTMFETGTPKFADFATYESKYSARNYNSVAQMQVKPSVFDIYPTFEQIDEDKRSNFYKTDSEGNVQYITNAYGRSLLRITDVFDALGGRFVFRVNPSKYSSIVPEAKKTIANEWLDWNFVVKAGQGIAENSTTINLNSVYLTDKRATGKTYEALTSTYSLQKIPALVTNPWDAVLKYPYKSIVVDLQDASKKLDIEIAENHLVANFDIKLNDFRDAISSTLVDVTIDEKVKDSNEAQLQELDYRNTNTAEANMCILNLDLRIENPTETLPSLQPITKYRSSSTTDEFKLDTTATELYIPEKGYGQALLGTYKLPEECLFEDGTFYVQSGKTVNSNGEQFKLVTAKGEPIVAGKDTFVPKMVYKSFAQANIALATELATVQDIELTDTLIDLSKLEIGYKSLLCKQLYLLDIFDFNGAIKSVTEDLTAKSMKVYETFQSNIKFSCKLLYSELPKDSSTNNIICLSTYSSNNYKSTELLEKLGYTRLYNAKQVPSNIRYLTSDGTYKITNTLLPRNINAYSVDADGNLLYLNEEGQAVSEVTVNTEPLVAVKKSQSLNLFTVSNDIIKAVVNECFYYSDKSIVPVNSAKSFKVQSSKSLRSMLAICNPNEATTSYSELQKVDSTIYSNWLSPTTFRFVFTNTDHIQVDLVYNKTFKDQVYNIAYLKDSSGNLIAKVFFEKPVGTDNLLVFQKED